MTIEDFRNRLLEMLCEAANDCANPADTLNALMDNIKSLLADIERGMICLKLRLITE